MHEIEAQEEQFISCTHQEQHRLMVICTHEPMLTAVDGFVADSTAGKGSVHVHVMAGEIESEEDLEDDHEGWVDGGQVADEPGSRTPVGDHVKDGAKLGAYDGLDVVRIG